MQAVLDFPAILLLMGISPSHGKSLEVGAFGIHSDDLPGLDTGPVDIASWFPADRRGLPLELEIGSGKGTFLVQQSPLCPDVNFVGLEYAAAFWRHAADRCRRNRLDNVRLVRAEAGHFLRQYVAEGLFSQVHLYFPDPWPKKRHHKRRLVQAPFLRLLHGKMTPVSQVRIATDHEDYFQWMLEHVGQVADLFEKLDFQSPSSAGEGEWAGTNFERKYRREGRPIFGMVLRKK